MIQRLTNSIFTILKISDLCWSSPLVLRLHNRTPSFFSQEFFAFWSQARHLLTSFPYSTLRIHSDQHSTFKKETSPSGLLGTKCQVPKFNVQCSGTWMPLRAATPQADISTVSGRTTGNLFKRDQFQISQHLSSIWPNHQQVFSNGIKWADGVPEYDQHFWQSTLTR